MVAGGSAGGAASVFIFHDWWIATGVMIDGINVRHWPPTENEFKNFESVCFENGMVGLYHMFVFDFDIYKGGKGITRSEICLFHK